MDTTLWSGNVRIVKGDDGKVRIYYKQDGTEVEACYEPHGFFENKAVNGLVEHLQPHS